MPEAVTLPNNFVTVFNSVNRDFGIELPWPKPESYVPPTAEQPFLIWGGSSSVGQYAIQILKFYGYKNILVTASKKHHALLESYGATHLFDYREANVIEQILETAADDIPYILDCIGSQKASIEPISRLAKSGAKVAILLPIILRDSIESEGPALYGYDVVNAAKWEEGVEVRGVRTHFYIDVSQRSRYYMLPEVTKKCVERVLQIPLTAGDHADDVEGKNCCAKPL